jgi:hypothetical protein
MARIEESCLLWQNPTTRIRDMINFDTTEKLNQHLINHVLTPEEAHAWYYIWQEDDSRLAPTPAGVDNCFQLRDSLHRNQELADSLTSRYLNSIAEQIKESLALQWTAQSNRRQVGFGLAGVFYVLAKDANQKYTLRTAFVPGFGTSDGTASSQQKPDNPHARNRAASWMRGERENQHPRQGRYSICQRSSEGRASQWNADQRLFFLVFRPAMQFLRGWNDWKQAKRLGMSDLKSKLPPMSRLKFDSWMELRKNGREGKNDA